MTHKRLPSLRFSFTLLVIGVTLGLSLAYVWDQGFRRVVSVVLSTIPGLGYGAEQVGGRLTFGRGDFEKPVLGTPQGVMATDESSISPKFERVLNLPGETVRRPARGVGQLRIQIKGEREFPVCTAFLISNELLLTAAHCLTGIESAESIRLMQSEKRPLSRIERLRVHFGYLDADQKYQGVALEVETKPAEYHPEHSLTYDYVVLKLKAGEVEKAKAKGFEPFVLPLGDVALKAKQEFYVLHYPKGEPLTLTRTHCKAIDAEPPVSGDRPYEINHLCDTMPGSSGAPVFSETHDAVIGIHVCCAYLVAEGAEGARANIAISLVEIAKHSPIIAKLIRTKLLTRREKLLVARSDILAEQSNQQHARQDYGLAGRLALAGLRPFVEPTAETLSDPVKRAAQLKDAEERLLPAAVQAQGALMRAMIENSELKQLRGHEDGVTSAAFSPDGTRIVTGSEDNTARLWDARSGAELKVLRGHENYVTSAAFSPDGTRIVTGSHDWTARLWDARNGAELKVLRGHENRVTSAAFSPDGAYSGEDGQSFHLKADSDSVRWRTGFR